MTAVPTGRDRKLIERDWELGANVCREVAALPDRTSPDDNADYMIVHPDELQPMVAAASAAARAEGRANTHAALIEALDAARKQLGYRQLGLFSSAENLAVIEQIDAALRAAKEG